MDNQFNPFDLKDYKHKIMEAYRTIFSGTIKESFLISILSTICTDPRYISVLKLELGDKPFSVYNTICGKNHSEINICKMIVMSHYKNTVLLTEQEKGRLQDSQEYRKKLIDEVFDMLQVEKLATFDFSISSLEAFYPLIYYLSALNNLFANTYDELIAKRIQIKPIYNSDFAIKMLSKIIVKIKSCVLLSDLRATDELSIIFRTLAETFMVYALLYNKDTKIIEKYYKFDRASFDYNYTFIVPEEFKKAAEEKHSKLIDYLNYGWIDELDAFKKLNKSNQKYKLGTIAELLDIENANFMKNFGTGLYGLYKSCNPQVHGTSLSTNYFQTELAIFQNIAVMAKFIHKILSNDLFGFELKIDGFDLNTKLDTAKNESINISNWLLNNQTGLDKTNQDYIKRHYAAIKIKSV